MVQVRASAAVSAALGTPIKEGFFTSGSVNVSGPSGKAELAIPISGPKGSATVYVEAAKSMGQWSFSKLVVAIEGGEEGRNSRIDLLVEDSSQ
jgi:hypothetical protein